MVLCFIQLIPIDSTASRDKSEYKKNMILSVILNIPMLIPILD